MKKLTLNVMAFALGVAFSAGVMAENMSKKDYQAAKDKISAEFKSAKASCSSLSGNQNDICIAEAKGKESVAKAELEDSYKPTSKTRYELQEAKAEAAFAVASERCDDVTANARDVCKKEAREAEISAKANAKAEMKISDTNAAAKEKSSAVNDKAKAKNSDTRKDAMDDKIDAKYEVELEKCGMYAGAAKDSCTAQVKSRFGKN